MTTEESRKFAVITGGSSGIGYEFAKVCAEEKFEVLIVADHELRYCPVRLPRSSSTGRACRTHR